MYADEKFQSASVTILQYNINYFFCRIENKIQTYTYGLLNAPNEGARRGLFMNQVGYIETCLSEFIIKNQCKFNEIIRVEITSKCKHCLS